MSATDLHDELGTSSGLPEQMTGTVAEAWFGRNEAAEGDFADKQYLWLKLFKIESDEYEGDEYTVRVGIGNGWVAVDGGARVVREDGKEKKFNNNTHLGKFLNRCMGSGGGKEGKEHAEKMEGALDALANNIAKIPNKEGLASTYAVIWEGLRFEFQSEEFNSTINGEESTWSWMLPVAFVGSDGESGESGANAGPASTNDTPPADTPTEGSLEQRLTELAKATGSHGEFVAQALQIDGVSASDLLASVADDSDNGLWAKANA